VQVLVLRLVVVVVKEQRDDAWRRGAHEQVFGRPACLTPPTRHHS
jgi:hypothetical protein